MANYQLNNFLATPTVQDTRIRIYDKNTALKYTIDPNIAFFFKNAHIAVIRIEDSNDIMLDFSSSSEATIALSKLNQAKQTITNATTTSTSTGGTVSSYSKSNLNMSCLVTVNDEDLVCSTGILDIPLQSSYVRVFINGVEVNTGGKTYPSDCYFSSDGITPRVQGDERLGDKLYWNKSVSGYNLDTNDLIDFVYLIEVSN